MQGARIFLQSDLKNHWLFNNHPDPLEYFWEPLEFILGKTVWRGDKWGEILRDDLKEVEGYWMKLTSTVNRCSCSATSRCFSDENEWKEKPKALLRNEKEWLWFGGYCWWFLFCVHHSHEDSWVMGLSVTFSKSNIEIIIIICDLLWMVNEVVHRFWCPVLFFSKHFRLSWVSVVFVISASRSDAVPISPMLFSVDGVCWTLFIKGG